MIARGSVLGARAGVLELALPRARLGTIVTIDLGTERTSATICALDERGVASAAVHGSTVGIAAGAPVWSDPTSQRLPLGICALGRAIDARGLPLDDGPPLQGPLARLEAVPVAPSARVAVSRPLWTGVRAIDAFVTLGAGARIGIFGAPGIGKSTLIESIVAGVACDAVVVALIGERGREAQQWIDQIDSRTCIVCATGDCSAAERVRAAEVAMAQAERLRARGLDVVLVLDSLARYAGAARDLAIAAGESVGRSGFPPSVVARMAVLLERCGAVGTGSTTLIATVLNDGDDRDPISEAARSLLDGHLQLVASLAHAGRYPAIDIQQSISRTMPQIVTAEHRDAAGVVRRALGELARTEEARSLGIVGEGRSLQAALRVEGRLRTLLEQSGQPSSPSQTLAGLIAIADTLEEAHEHLD